MGERDVTLNLSHDRLRAVGLDGYFSGKHLIVFFRTAVVLAFSVAAGRITHCDLLAQLIQQSHTIRIQTTPGAKIYVEGTFRGHADASGGFAIPVGQGTYGIRIEMDRKKPFVHKIIVPRDSKDISIPAVLADVTGILEVLTASGAEISVDEKPAGRARADGRWSMNLPVGEVYRIRASRQDRASAFARAAVRENAVSTVTLMLDEVVVKMRLDASAELGKLVFRRAFANPQRREWVMAGCHNAG